MALVSVLGLMAVVMTPASPVEAACVEKPVRRLLAEDGGEYTEEAIVYSPTDHEGLKNAVANCLPGNPKGVDCRDNCDNLLSPLAEWQVSQVSSMNGMFYDKEYSGDGLEGWDVSGVTDMESMFSRAIYNEPLGYWTVAKCRSMKHSEYGRALPPPRPPPPLPPPPLPVSLSAHLLARFSRFFLSLIQSFFFRPTPLRQCFLIRRTTNRWGHGM
jgi:hypothetical protein